MTLNDIQVQLILQQGLVPQAILEQARQQYTQDKDLLTFLIEQRVLNQIVAESLRAESLKVMRAHLSAELGQHLIQDRWFKPHADYLWQKGEKLGEGGMGAVYRVKDQCLDRYGALKLVLGNDEKALSRFLREVKMTARLDHPAIPPVYDAGITGNGQYYMVMKVIEGQTLKERIETIYDGRSPTQSEIRELLQVLVRVGEALSYAHSQGVLHRDLKPENIMIGRFGEVLVLDWGIAKDLNGDDVNESEDTVQWQLTDEQMRQSGLTLTGSFVGTPGYMAPEQFDGVFSEQSDVFSLGLILSELLTGQKAVNGNSAIERIGATLAGSFQLPRAINKRAPRELNSLSERALDLDLARRITTAEQFTDELKRYLSGERLSSYSYSIFEIFFRWSSQHPGMIVSFAFGILLLSLIFVFQEAIQKSEKEKGAALDSLSKAQQSEAKTRQSFARISKLEQAALRGLPKTKVLGELDEALAEVEPDYSLLLAAARICHSLGEFDREREFLKDCIVNHPPAYEALFMQHKLNSPEAFLVTPSLREIARRAKERGEINEFTLTLEALALYNKKDYENALSRLTKLEKYSTKFSFGYCLRGIIRGEQKLYKEAFVDIEYARKLDPKNHMILYNHGFLLFCMGRWPEALESYNASHKIKPNEPLLLQRRGVVKHLLKDHKGALADFNLAIKLNPKDAQGYFLRGKFHCDREDYQAARNDLQRSLQADPDNIATLSMLGYTKMKLGQFAAALYDLNRCISIDPNYLSAYNNRAMTYLKQKRCNEAIADFDRYLKENPTNASALFNRGVAKHTLKQYTAAMDDYKAALKIDPQNSIAHHQYTLALDAAGRFEEAEKYVTLCIQRIQGYSTGYKLRCAIRIKLKNFQGAALDCEQYLKLTPQDRQATEMRNFVKKHLGRPSRY